MKRSLLTFFLILALSAGTKAQTALKSWWSLKYCTAYSNQNVRAFDSLVGTNGAGYFVWYKIANNAGILDIPGIQIKPKGTTKGYWKRAYDGPIHVDWMGGSNLSTQKTWAELGYRQSKLDSMYQGFVPFYIDSTFRPDETALIVAYSAMENGYNAIDLSPRNYYIWKEISSPRTLSGGFADKYQFVINGNGAIIRLKTNDACFLSRVPGSQSIANDSWVGAAFIISDLIIDGGGFTTTGIRIGASSNSMISNVVFKNCYIGLDARFCLQMQTFQTEGNNCAYIDMLFSYGNWTDASRSNSQSNRVRVNGHRTFGGGGYAGIYMAQGSNCSVVDMVIEGGGANWGVLLDCRDGGGSSIVKEFLVDNIYGEGDYDSAAVGIMNGDGIYTVQRVYVRGTQNIVWAEDPAGAYPQLNLYEVAWFDNTMNLVQIGSGWCWDVRNFNYPGSSTYTATDFATGNAIFNTVPGSSQTPLVARVRIAPKIIN